MKDLYDACERQQNLSKVFHSHEQEIDNIVQILKVIERESVLQVATMMGIEEIEAAEEIQNLRSNARGFNHLRAMIRLTFSLFQRA